VAGFEPATPSSRARCATNHTPISLVAFSRSLLADNCRLMALDQRGPRQSDRWFASPSGKSPFLLILSDKDQHVISLILASTVIVKSMKGGHMRPKL
jgi:hypothetical protein